MSACVPGKGGRGGGVKRQQQRYMWSLSLRRASGGAATGADPDAEATFARTCCPCCCFHWPFCLPALRSPTGVAMKVPRLTAGVEIEGRVGGSGGLLGGGVSSRRARHEQRQAWAWDWARGSWSNENACGSLGKNSHGLEGRGNIGGGDGMVSPGKGVVAGQRVGLATWAGRCGVRYVAWTRRTGKLWPCPRARSCSGRP